MNEWKESACKFQQEKYKIFGKRRWDDLNGSEDNLREKLIVPFELCFGENYQSILEFKKKADSVETQLLKLFYDKNCNKNFDLTYIYLKKKNDHGEEIKCVFWLQSKNGPDQCVDLDGRAYKSWDDFIKNNVFPKCHMIYPKHGVYYRPYNQYYIDLVLEESVACGARRSIKKFVDVITAVGGIAAVGVLVCNPVSGPLMLGASAVTLATGAYSAGNNINQLVDVHKHEGGLSLKESKTLKIVGGLAIDVAGTAAMGLSAGIKGFEATTGKVLSEGSVASRALRVANSLSKVARVVSIVNVGITFIAVMDNFSLNRLLTNEDLAVMKKTLFYVFNAYTSDILIKMLISFLDNHVDVGKINDCLKIAVSDKATEFVRKYYKFYSENDFRDLIQLILPNFVHLHDELISPVINNIHPIRPTSSIVVRPTFSSVNIGKVSSDNFPLLTEEEKSSGLAYNDDKKKENEDSIKEKVDKEIYDTIRKWTDNNVFHLFGDSKFDSNISTVDKLEEQIEKTVRLLFKTAGHEGLDEKQKILNKLLLHKIRSEKESKPSYVINMMNFYCNAFELFYEDLLKSYEDSYKYFCCCHEKNDNMDERRLFFRKHYNTDDISEYVFSKSVLAFKDEFCDLHKKFEQFKRVNHKQ